MEDLKFWVIAGFIVLSCFGVVGVVGCNQSNNDSSLNTGVIKVEDDGNEQDTARLLNELSQRKTIKSEIPSGIIVEPIYLGGGVYYLQCGPYVTYPFRNDLPEPRRLPNDFNGSYYEYLDLYEQANKPTSYTKSIKAFCTSHPKLRIIDITPAIEEKRIVYDGPTTVTTAVFVLTEPM